MAVKSNRERVAAKSSKISAQNLMQSGEEAAPGDLRSMIQNLPTPEELAKYEKVVPGGAERLIELAERQASHQQAVQRRTLESAIRAAQVKTVIGFILALSIGVLGGMLLLKGSELAGLILILIDAAAIATIAIYGRDSRS